MPGYASAWQVKSAFWDMFTVTFSGGETMYGGPEGKEKTSVTVSPGGHFKAVTCQVDMVKLLVNSLLHTTSS